MSDETFDVNEALSDTNLELLAEIKKLKKQNQRLSNQNLTLERKFRSQVHIGIKSQIPLHMGIIKSNLTQDIMDEFESAREEILAKIEEAFDLNSNRKDFYPHELEPKDECSPKTHADD